MNCSKIDSQIAKTPTLIKNLLGMTVIDSLTLSAGPLKRRTAKSKKPLFFFFFFFAVIERHVTLGELRKEQPTFQPITAGAIRLQGNLFWNLQRSCPNKVIPFTASLPQPPIDLPVTSRSLCQPLRSLLRMR
jgi:hypothetical protein